MKLPGFQDYRREDTERSEAALLTIWPKLADFHDDLVLVGGLAPRYLCRELADDEYRPHTLDVDLAIALAADVGMYAPLSERLMSEGFTPERSRFKKVVGRTTLCVDFLTERPSAQSPSSVTVSDLIISAFPGVDRALKRFRRVPILGCNLDGARATETIKVCEVGPFLCLKLQAYAHRAERKDVFDCVYTASAYDGGPAQAVAAFQAEEGSNLAYPVAREILLSRFKDEQSKGAVDYAVFCLGDRAAASDEARFRRSRLAADAVTAAHLLVSRLG